MNVLLRQVRLSKGISLRQLAKLVQINRSSLSMMELNRRPMNQNQLGRCSAVLHVHVCDLLDTEPHPEKEEKKV